MKHIKPITMETLIIIGLILAGLLLFIVEVFLIPGISLAGIASAASLIYAVYFAFANMGMQAGFITLAVAAVGVIGVTIWFMRSKTVDRLSLKKTLDYRPDPLEGSNLQVGDKGTAITRLTLIGNADINGHIIEVQSADGFIDERSRIEISRINNGVVYVKRTQE